MKQKPTDNSIKTLKVMWIVFLVTPLIFLVPVFSLAGSQSASDIPAEFRIALAFFGLVIFGVALFLRRMIPAAVGAIRIQKYFFCWIANEMIALVAVAGSIISGDFYFFLPFFPLSILLTLTLPPRID